MPSPRLAALAAVALLAIAPAAHAGSTPSISSATACPPPSTVVFSAWGDPNPYFLVAGGDFEASPSSWTLTGGAATQAGNETFYVHGAKDARSLSLPSGATATSTPFCVSATIPSMRMFVRNAGATASRLGLDVIYTKTDGTKGSVQVASFAGTATWTLTPSTAYYSTLVGIVPTTASGTSMVWFRFRPLDATGAWSIDDVYVDPYKKL